jgi:hypothetical protein
MEDAHIADVSLEEDCCIFGVFDGHGGQNLEKNSYLTFLVFRERSGSFCEKAFHRRIEKEPEFQGKKNGPGPSRDFSFDGHLTLDSRREKGADEFEKR